jgi:DNA-binding FadR family transcriptional regulator
VKTNRIKTNRIKTNKIKRITLVDSIVEQMIQAIKLGRFKEGDKIPSEKELTAEFGVSRTTLREAFKKLEYAGAISIKQGNGTYLTDVEKIMELETTIQTDITKQIQEVFKLGEYSLTSYLDAREFIELASISKAIENWTENDLLELEAILEKQKNCVNDPNLYAEADHQFHSKIVDISKNEFFKMFWLIITPYMMEQNKRTFRVKGVTNNSHQIHMNIYQAIKNKNTDLAKSLTVEHIRIIPGRMLYDMPK